jgi:NAD(P)-dependent dehydrogenase (short-subunit alcohol dehydrogenase family)
MNNKSSFFLIDNLFSVKDKICIITGSSGGIGKEISKLLELNGAIVIRIDKKKINKQKNFYKTDLSNESKCKKIINDIYTKYKRIDSLVNIAGISDNKNFINNINVNLILNYQITNLVIKKMIKRKKGSIVNITSLNAVLGFKDNPGYVASKGGLKQLTKSFAMDYSNKNIRFNNVGPGYIKTNMTIKSFNNPKKKKQRLDRILIKRFGRPDDLLGIIIYLISDASNYVTGQDFYVDGGFLCKGI